jgi:pimeloyl-ACP methyl ester carboxylesterase
MSTVPRPFTFESSDGLTLSGERAGVRGGQPVILLHGGGQTRHSWSGAVRELATRGYEVINLDARGHGDSQWADQAHHYSLSHLADDLMRIIDSLSELPVLVGASMGGLTALQTIGTHSNPVAAALVLVDIVPRIEKDGADRILRFMNGHPEGFATVEEAAAAVAAYNPTRKRPRNATGLMKNLRTTPTGRLRWHWDPKMLQELRADDLESSQSLLHRCRHFSAPALLVRGMQSDMVSESGIAELKASLPQLEVFDVEQAGHMIAGDKNDVFNAGVLDFLERHRP